MAAVEIIFALAWGAFWLYWLAAATTMKQGRNRTPGWIGMRVVLLVAVILLVRTGIFRNHDGGTDPGRAAIGLLLLVGGLGFAIWARLHIGRNWGPPMSQRDEPDLVTTGPYRLVRHPIYSGILLAGVGTAVALSWFWLIIVGLMGLYFVSSAKVEERFLVSEFPDSYPAYRRSTKMLIPYLF